MSYFDTYGPFDVCRTEGTVSGKQKQFWSDVKENAGPLAEAIGCYLFCIRHGTKYRPWYVGMTAAKTGFKGEVFQPHKLSIYNECLGKQRGAAVMFLFPLITDGEDYQFSRATKSKRQEIARLETTLMGFAYRRNPEISNVRDMKFLRNIEVLGLLGKRRGRPFREAVEVRRALLGARSTP